MAAKWGGDRFERGLQVLRRRGGGNYDGPIKRQRKISRSRSRYDRISVWRHTLATGLDLGAAPIVHGRHADRQWQRPAAAPVDMMGFLNAGGQPRALAELSRVELSIDCTRVGERNKVARARRK